LNEAWKRRNFEGGCESGILVKGSKVGCVRNAFCGMDGRFQPDVRWAKSLKPTESGCFGGGGWSCL
jgi:hypothetical protein